MNDYPRYADEMYKYLVRGLNYERGEADDAIEGITDRTIYEIRDIIRSVGDNQHI